MPKHDPTVRLNPVSHRRERGFLFIIRRTKGKEIAGVFQPRHEWALIMYLENQP